MVPQQCASPNRSGLAMPSMVACLEPLSQTCFKAYIPSFIVGCGGKRYCLEKGIGQELLQWNKAQIQTMGLIL